jgi:hypothetical protein
LCPELEFARRSIALIGSIANETHLTIRAVAQILTWATAIFCLVRGVPVFVEGWRFFASEAVQLRTRKTSAGAV